MQTITVNAMDVNTYAQMVASKGKGTFTSKARRDVVAKLLKQAGKEVRKTSIRNQNLHPQYVTDYAGTYSVGFGNTDYNTFFSVLYIVEVR